MNSAEYVFQSLDALRTVLTADMPVSDRRRTLLAALELAAHRLATVDLQDAIWLRLDCALAESINDIASHLAGPPLPEAHLSDPTVVLLRHLGHLHRAVATRQLLERATGSFIYCR